MLVDSLDIFGVPKFSGQSGKWWMDRKVVTDDIPSQSIREVIRSRDEHVVAKVYVNCALHDDVHIRALVDTGAQMTLINEAMIGKMKY